MSTSENQGAWVEIKWKPGAPQNAWKVWNGNPKIKSGWATAGEWNCKLLVNSKDPAEVEKFVWDNIRKNEWVETTRTTWGWQWN